MEHLVRPVREQDAPAIAALLNEIIAAGAFTIMDGPITADDQLAYIRGFPERGTFYVALLPDDRTVLGIQSVEPISPSANALKHVGDISTFVALDSRGSGIGTSLSRVTFREARAKGFLKLMATIRSDNPNAVSFYSSQGFTPIGVAHKHAYVQGRYIDEVMMERLLD
ncbi:MAG: N-acetyltransferase family protein [Rudaea sp.]